jgi:DNA anti-recombination protein RmuC
MYKRHSKFQDTKNKEYKKTQEQMNEIICALNKHQSETENTINREINELKTKIASSKEEVTHDMEKPGKRMKQKYKRQWKATSAD